MLTGPTQISTTDGGLPSVLPKPLPCCKAKAVAELLPLLACGEEAAAEAFDNLAESAPNACDRALLYAIAREEEHHQTQVAEAALLLPPVEADRAMLRQARHFHAKLGRGTPAQRLASIAAVDAATCLILSRLFRQNSFLATSGSVGTVFRSIHRDEARHVQASRRQAILSGVGAANLIAAADEARSGLAQLVAMRADSFEVLAIDPDVLIRDVRVTPRALFVG